LKRLYDYRCKACLYECEKLVDDRSEDVLCPKCCKPMTKLFSSPKYRVKAGDFFEPYLDTNIHPEGEPIAIANRTEFESACRKHGRGWRAIKDKMR